MSIQDEARAEAERRYPIEPAEEFTARGSRQLERRMAFEEGARWRTREPSDDFGDESITRNRAARIEAVMLLARHPAAAAYLRRLEQQVQGLHRALLHREDLRSAQAQAWDVGWAVGRADERKAQEAYAFGDDWSPSPNPHRDDREKETD